MSEPSDPRPWLQALLALQPPGRALSREPGAVWTRLLDAIAMMLEHAQGRLEAMQRQAADPSVAIDLLPEWERLLGLPDACVIALLQAQGLTQSTPDRQRAALQRLVEQGGQSRAYFIGLAEQLGEPGCTITEFSMMTCNDNCNDALYSQVDEFTWRVNVPRQVENLHIANCNDHCNIALQSYTPSAIECAFNERKPAHTQALFAYLP